MDLQRKIEKIGGYLDPSGVEVEGLELAEDQKDDLKRKLDNLEGQRNRFLTEIHRLENDNERLSDRYDRRLDQFRAQRHQDEVAKVRGKQREDQEATDERLGRQEWRLAIDQTTQGLSKDDADWLDRQLLLEADVVLDNGGEIPDFAAWMKLAAVPYLARVANTAGSRDATLARLKQRDAYQPAPRGDQAHAVTQDLSNLSPRERRRMIDRDVGRKSRDLLYRPTG